jgi:hypothetical protein
VRPCGRIPALFLGGGRLTLRMYQSPPCLMKVPFIFSSLLCLLAFCGTAAAATLVVNQGFPPDTNGMTVQTAGGTSLSGGGYYIAAGSFASVPVLDPGGYNLFSLVDSMVIFGTVISDTSGSSQGAIRIVQSSGSGGNPALNNQVVWLVIGNGATRETSTEFAIIDLGVLFPSDITSPATTVKVASGVGTVNTVVGSEIDSPAGTRDIIVLAVPEPASGLLGLLGGLGLLRRRRR